MQTHPQPPNPKPSFPGLLSRVSAVFAGLLLASSALAATITYNFNDGTLQGWHNRVWDLSANGGSGGWVDIAENVSAMPATINGGAIQPPSADNYLFGNKGSIVEPAAGQNDNHLNTIWLRSPRFMLDGSGDLTAQMAKGKANGPAPANEAAVSYVAADGNAATGWKGVILRNETTGAFLLARPRTTTGDGWVTVTFTQAELAPFVGAVCTLELLNSEKGGWGWLVMDNVSIPGVLRQVRLDVVAPSVTIGGSTTALVTIPLGLNASSAVTAYVTNGSPTRANLNGSSATPVAVTFAAGATNVQTVTVTGTALGYVSLSVGSAGLYSSQSGLAVLSGTGLIGRWITGSQDLADKAGFAPAGTHDGAMGDTFIAAFSADVPPGAPVGANSLDLAASSGAVIISNTVSTATGYLPTFDAGVAKQMSVVFWAKGLPNEWNPILSKYGENTTGWQIRRHSSFPIATFTLRGTPGEDDPETGATFIDDYGWHHFAAVWDGVTGMRKLYVDGKPNIIQGNDFGPMGLATGNYLCLGGRVNNAGSASPENLFAGQLFDVRIYGVPLTGSAVQDLFTGNTSAVLAYADTSSLDLGKTGVISVAIPAAANASTAVTVYVTNTTPSIVSMAGAVGNVATVVFPAGGANSQKLTLTGLAAGQAQLACASAGLISASLAVDVHGQRLIGRWFTGTESLTDTSGFAPAGSHDGTEYGGAISYSIDTPPSKSGKSAQFGGGVGVVINNSCQLDPAYLPTFDDLVSRQFTLGFWAKGIPGGWAPFISKRGEDGIGWQMRRGPNTTEAFTIRGTGSGNADGVGSVAINDGQWHHYTAVWDGYSGTRKCYVDGNLDPSINLTGDFGPFLMAPNHRLVLGGRETRAIWSFPNLENTFNGLLYDVEMYNYPLSEAQVKTLAFVPALRVIPAERSLMAPLTMTVDVILPVGANQTQPVTVQVTDNTPTIASLSGAVGNVVTLTYPVGGSLTQQVTVAGIKDGTAKLTATGGGFVAANATFSVWADPGSRLIGHWLSGAADLVETSGFRPAGTHDGVAVGPNAGLLMFSADVPLPYAGGTAQSLDLTAGNVAVIITNSSIIQPGYAETFDHQISNKFSVTFWAKGTPLGGDWNPWISKYGEGDYGFQIRRFGGDNPARPTFTLRGTVGDDDPWLNTTVDSDTWHHYAATWDGTTGLRKLYLDGNTIMGLTGDFGPMGMATSEYLVLGGRDNNGVGNFFSGLLFDVRIYSHAISALDVSALVNPVSALTLALSPQVAPLNEPMRLVVSVPASATATGPLTVYLTNNSPTVVTIVGSTGNVFPLTFPANSTVQEVTLLTIGVGQIDITAGAAGQISTGLTTVNTVAERKLIGHWFNGAADLTDKSGYTTAGTHDAVVVGANPEALAFSADVPPGFQGQSLDLTANATGTVGVMVTNSAAADPGYQPTFDAGISGSFTIAVWAKGVPNGWDTFVGKRGEDGIGWQIRRSGGNEEAFTIRGTASGNADGVGSVNIMDGGVWRHYVGVWNGLTGTRKCYVNGVLDPNVNITGDFAPMSMAPNHHLAIGTREQNTMGLFESWFNGKIFDVRVYNYAITAEDAGSLAGLAPARPALKVQAASGNQIRISWPTSFVGYSIQQSASASTGWGPSGLSVGVEGSENVAYAPAAGSAQFYRLQK